MNLRRVALMLLIAGGSSPLWAAPTAAISLIVDDLGEQHDAGLRALKLPGAVAYSFLPGTPHSAAQANAAHRAGREVLLHLPLEHARGRPYPLGLAREFSRDEWSQRFAAALESVPHARGVNNHQGSLLTQLHEPMQWLMREIETRRGLYFVDSRTHPQSVAYDVARERGVPATQRQVFLDSDRTPDGIRGAWRHLIAVAQRHGSALAIAHPYPETLDLLEQALPALAQTGVRLVPPSELIEIQHGRFNPSAGPATTAAAH